MDSEIENFRFTINSNAGHQCTFVYDCMKENSLGNNSGKVYFTKYRRDELFSHTFSGCIMAAFSFTDNILKVEKTGNVVAIIPNTPYIAHVYTALSEEQGDAKYQFAQMESDGVIKIHAMFKPFVGERDSSDTRDWYSRQPATSIHGLTGSMFYSKNQKGWIGNSYYQDVQKRPVQLKNYFDKERLLVETFFLKGFLGIFLGQEEIYALDSKYSRSYINGLAAAMKRDEPHNIQTADIPEYISYLLPVCCVA